MKLFKYLLMSLLLLVPTFALADTIIHPPGADMWELYVMGNGPTIASVLEAIKLVIAPDAGGGGFRSLLLFMAITGFCILAIQAGFNPGANLFKMFGYLFVVWVVSLTATQLKAHLIIIDPVSRTETTVMKVPAVVAIPAAVVSGVGHYLTTTIQQAYSTAGNEVQLTDSGFDIFGKIQSDLDNYTLALPGLQRSMGAYVSDCAIPAIAQNRITANQLLSSSNLIDTLKHAQSKVFLTRVWKDAPPSDTPSTSIGLHSDIITCTDAFAAIQTELEAHAKQMFDASTREWTRSGVMVPFEQTLQTYVEAAHLGKADGGGTYGRPTALITQKALVNTLSGDFRQAAISTGNNELLMGLQISQAEQSQRSGWVTSAAVFKNMMGYVYTTLQAFIFAVVPIVVVALMIPGLGKKIFVNYGQILVWLTLWEPMLSIVNYLVTLFRLEGVRNAVAAAGGITLMNNGAISEGANNMVIAASFLGTMVPILSWGLVTGAMAFNEFISHGIGSSFAMTAGANAATGAVGLNNASMNTMKANEFGTAHKSTVGNQSVMAHETAGILTASSDLGGSEFRKDGSPISSQGSHAKSYAESEGTSLNGTKTTSGGTGASASEEARHAQSASEKQEHGVSSHREQGASSAKSGSHMDSAGTSASTNKSAKTGQGTDISDSATLSANLQSAAGVGGGGGAGGAGGAGGGGLGKLAPKTTGTLSGQQSSTNSSKISGGLDESGSTGANATSISSIGSTAASTAGNGIRETVGTGSTFGSDSSRSSSAGSSTNVNTSGTLAEGASTSKTAGTTMQQSFSAPLDQTRDDIERRLGMVSASLDGPGAAIAAQNESIYGAVRSELSGAASTIGSAASNLQGAGANPGGFEMGTAAGTGADMSALGNYGNSVASSTAAVNAGVAAQTGAATSLMSNNLAGSQSLIATQLGIGAGPTGGAPFAVNDDLSLKKTGLGVAGATSAVTSMLGTGLGGAAMARGTGMAASALGPTLGPLAVGTLGVGAAAAGGWYAGRQISEFVGQERMTNALTPAFQKFDSAMGIQH